MDTKYQVVPHAFTNLGGKRRIVKPEDPILGGGAIAPVYNFPATKAKPVNRRYYFQGQQPACGAHAGTSLVDSLQLQEGVAAVPYNTPRDLWINIKEDGTDPNDGTTMDRIFDVLATSGTIPFEPLENNVLNTVPDYASPSALTAADIAQQGKVVIDPKTVKYLSDRSLNGLKQAINDYGAVLILIDVCARFWTAANGETSWAAKDIIPLGIPSTQFPVIDGHFIVADWYDETGIGGPNSFGGAGTGGAIWGLDGDFYFEANYLPWVIEAGVAKLPVAVPNPTVAVAQTVEESIPQIQNAINNLKTLTPTVEAQHVSKIQEWIDDLKALIGMQ